MKNENCFGKTKEVERDEGSTITVQQLRVKSTKAAMRQKIFSPKNRKRSIRHIQMKMQKEMDVLVQNKTYNKH